MSSNIFFMEIFLIHFFFPTRFLGKVCNHAIPYTLLFGSAFLMTSVCLLDTELVTHSVLCGPAAFAQPESLAEMHNLRQDEAAVGRDERMGLALRKELLRYLKETFSNPGACMKPSFFVF